MGRFLFVASPIVGHIFPTIPVGRELMDRGHEVAWVGHTNGVAEFLPDWAPFISLADAMPPEVLEAIRAQTGRAAGGVAGFVGVWRDYVVPVARQMLPGVHAAIDAFAPDVVVVDQQALAGAVAAEARGLPWATTATTSVELVGWVGETMADVAEQYLDPATITYLTKVRDWLKALIRDLVVELGLDPARAGNFDPRFSSRLVLAFTTPEMLGFDARFPDHFALLGPSIGERPDEIAFPWDWLDEAKPLVLVSLGTINWRGGRRFFKAAAEALSTMDVQAVFIAPDGIDFEPPPNVLVREKVPQLALLDHVAAVVSHGGQNTVTETLAVGRPLVVAPIRDDQPLVADQVSRAGAGVTVRFSRVTADQLRGALESVLFDKRFRAAAEDVQASFRSAGGPPEAADRLESLLAATRGPGCRGITGGQAAG
jgi:MGT family glycosyltransferase